MYISTLIKLQPKQVGGESQVLNALKTIQLYGIHHKKESIPS